MSAVLDLRVKRPAVPVPEADWTWKTEAQVISYMIARSGLGEKAVAIEIGIDPSTLAKVKQGTARLPEDALQKLMDCTGSNAWIIYQLLRRNYDPSSLRQLETEQERLRREAEEALAKEREKVQLLTDLLERRGHS